jgi:hypothetical protein
MGLCWFYNAPMRNAYFTPPLLALVLCCQGFALAQAPDPADKPDQTIEIIHHEDKGARIDELRVGGETKNITVSPKGHFPSYELKTEGGNRSPTANNRDGSTSGSMGSSGWKVLGF